MSDTAFPQALQWYEGPGTPDDGTWWWAVEHFQHPAFYLRALLPGDYAPGRMPLARHALQLDGERKADLRCGTCGQAPRGEDLDPVERRTGARGFLGDFRSGRARWPKPTAPGSCWECSDPRQRISAELMLGDERIRVCAGCAAHLEARGLRRPVEDEVS